MRCAANLKLKSGISVRGVSLRGSQPERRPLHFYCNSDTFPPLRRIIPTFFETLRRNLKNSRKRIGVRWEFDPSFRRSIVGSSDAT